MPFDDKQWDGLQGAYRVPYDPRPAMTRLMVDAGAAWSELWQELYHQGDVGVASYAAVTQFVPLIEKLDPSDWNGFALASTIEEARVFGDNPGLPEWLAADYFRAWDKLQAVALQRFAAAESAELIDSLLGVLAFSKRRNQIGKLCFFTDDELAELVQSIEAG